MVHRPVSDDPKDPGQKKRQLTDDLEKLIQENIGPFNRRVEPAISAWAKNGKELTEEMKAFMLYGFVAETGLKPQECVLIVQKPSPTTMTYFFAKVEGEQDKLARFKKMSDDADYAKAQLEGARQHIKLLRHEVEELLADKTHLTKLLDESRKR